MKPMYQIELAQDDVVLINKSLRWWKEHIDQVRQPEVYEATNAQNLSLIGDIERQDGKIQFGIVDLDSSEIGYIRMCLVEYGRAHSGILGQQMGQYIEDDLHARIGDLARRLDGSIDPALERTYNRGMITINEAASALGLPYNSLVKAAREGRIAARQSGSIWLTTEAAIRQAIRTGSLRPRK